MELDYEGLFAALNKSGVDADFLERLGANESKQ